MLDLTQVWFKQDYFMFENYTLSLSSLDFAVGSTTDLRTTPAIQRTATDSGWSIWRLSNMIYERLGKEKEEQSSDAF